MKNIYSKANEDLTTWAQGLPACLKIVPNIEAVIPQCGNSALSAPPGLKYIYIDNNGVVREFFLPYREAAWIIGNQQNAG